MKGGNSVGMRALAPIRGWTESLGAAVKGALRTPISVALATRRARLGTRYGPPRCRGAGPQPPSRGLRWPLLAAGIRVSARLPLRAF